MQIKEEEVTLPKEELDLKRKEIEQKRTLKLSPLAATIMAALFGLLGTWIGAYVQGRANIKLEEKRLESSLILKAVETADRKEAKNNLIFFINAGFIEDPDSLIRNALELNTPVLPSTDLSSIK